ncbi:kinase-like protein [Glonium stellatum]|uniref:Kinase-like protein n=1 Tax=Glonium stellatum TaxID=574774 RepID=A0A8E2JRX5_9PEZI|nr:kinase-like protein [Glonium stellatum]
MSCRTSSTFTASFVTARSANSILDFKAIDSSTYGTSCFRTSPLTQALSNESSSPILSRVPSAPSTPSAPTSSHPGSSEYLTLIESKNLLPSVMEEFNWSGRKPGSGQHVEFDPYEEIPLEVCRLLGESLTAKIEAVRCKRILLARKSMVCNRKLKLVDALVEVEHLQKLRHAHIVQLVGSYFQGRTFAILLYPVANWHLRDFMLRVEKILASPYGLNDRDLLAVTSPQSFFGCLAAAIEYIHSKTTKHMDIKPQNILVKFKADQPFAHHVYVADFGISRSFSPLDHSQTDSIIPRTRKYCAPEVYAYEKRGRSSDIFSLGCVFLEMQTTLCGQTIDAFDDFRAGDMDDTSFHGNLSRVHEWSRKLRGLGMVSALNNRELSDWDPVVSYSESLKTKIQAFLAAQGVRLYSLISAMLDLDPSARPSASLIAGQFAKQSCCDKGPEKFREELQDMLQHGHPHGYPHGLLRLLSDWIVFLGLMSADVDSNSLRIEIRDPHFSLEFDFLNADRNL